MRNKDKRAMRARKPKGIKASPVLYKKKLPQFSKGEIGDAIKEAISDIIGLVIDSEWDRVAESVVGANRLMLYIDEHNDPVVLVFDEDDVNRAFVKLDDLVDAFLEVNDDNENLRLASELERHAARIKQSISESDCATD